MSPPPPPASPPSPDRAAVAPALLAWYDRHRRSLPWRSAPGVVSDPYAVWLSEIMLQQTTVAAVKSYYAAFLAAWPTVTELAAAPLERVLQAWAGLGYYSRARNLHACAKLIVADHGGRFPEVESELRTLPGVGAYTAAAIAAIAFDRRAVVVDGNVERVMARLFAIETPLPQAKPQLRAAMDKVTPDVRPGDFAQAMMDLGATICTPRGPACAICPLLSLCAAQRSGQQAELPRRAKKAEVPERGGAVFIVERVDGAVLIRTRPPTGLFGGLPEFPSTPWVEAFDFEAAAVVPEALQIKASSARRIGRVTHGLTHFTLTLDVHHIVVAADEAPLPGWTKPEDLDAVGFPTLMRKVLTLYRTTRAASAAKPAPIAAESLSLPRPPSREPVVSRRRRRRRTGSLPGTPSR